MNCFYCIIVCRDCFDLIVKFWQVLAKCHAVIISGCIYPFTEFSLPSFVAKQSCVQLPSGHNQPKAEQYTPIEQSIGVCHPMEQTMHANKSEVHSSTYASLIIISLWIKNTYQQYLSNINKTIQS